MRCRSIRSASGLAFVLALATGCGSGPDSAVAPLASTSVAPTTDAPTSNVPTSNVPGQPMGSTTAPSVTPPSPPGHLVGDPDTEWFDFVVSLATVGAGDRDVSAAIVRDGRVIHTLVAGRDATLTESSRFRIASISKTVTAARVLQLVAEGRVSLDDRPLSEVAESLDTPLGDPRLADVTVRQLLSHTSGLSSFRDAFFDSPGATIDDVLRSVLGGTLDHDPGQGFLYSNANFALLGRWIESLTGEAIDEQTRREVFDPLGLHTFRYGVTQVDEPGDADHYSRPDRNFLELLGPAGAWTASASDVALFVDSLAEGRVLANPELSTMIAPVATGPDEEGWSYGLGVIVWPNGWWGHTGSVESARSIVVAIPGGSVVAILVNGDEPMASGDLAQVVADALAPRPQPEVADPDT